MSIELLTTREAARILGVGTTSVKRWADAGILACVKTPGGHRRYPRAAVESLRDQPGGPGDAGATSATSTAAAAAASVTEWAASVTEWIDLLTDDDGEARAAERLLIERHRRGSWFAVADALGLVLVELGRGWARGALSVIDEHLASERLARALARCSEGLPLPKTAPCCLLVTAERDDHTLGLTLLEPCLREAGWRPKFSGRSTPLHFVCEFVATERVDMVAISASSGSRDASALADQAGRLGEVCARLGIPLLLGGHGLWPDEPEYGHRVRSFAELRVLLDGGLARAGEHVEH
ncbi:MAG: hypothetical protein Tsb0020_36720 [Haliangiales bacterium]